MPALENALSGLVTAKSQIDLRSHCIANANTKGFTDQAMETEPLYLGNQGAGVRALTPRRVIDTVLVKDERAQISQTSFYAQKNVLYEKIQVLFGSPRDGNSLGELIKNFSNTCNALATTPNSTINAKEVLRTLDVFHQKISSISNNIQKLRQSCDLAIKGSIEEVNTQLQMVAILNEQITGNYYSSQATGDLEDQRDNAIRMITSHMNVQIFEDDTGAIDIRTPQGISLVKPQLQLLSFTPVATISVDSMYNADPLLSTINPITVAGPLGGLFDMTYDISAGDIAAYVEMRDTVLPNLQKQLDRLATDFRDQVNAMHNLGTSTRAASTLTGTRAFTDVNVDTFQGSGILRFGILNSAGEFVGGTFDLDLSTMNGFTIAQVASTIDAGINTLNGTASASAAGGNLVLSTGSSTQGIAMVPVTATATETTTGLGFSHYFGLNDLILTENYVYQTGTPVPGISQMLDIRSDIMSLDQLLSRGTLNNKVPAPVTPQKAVYDGDGSAMLKIVDVLTNSRLFAAAGNLTDATLNFFDYGSYIISENASRAKDNKNLYDGSTIQLENVQFSLGKYGVDIQTSIIKMLEWQQVYQSCSKIIALSIENNKALMAAF